MGASLIGLVLGALAGAVTGTELGVVTGGVLGLLVGLSIYAFGWMRSHFGNAPVVERHLVMCDRYGQAAHVDFAGDRDNGRWYDVVGCSLLGSSAEVDCHKGCVRLMTSAHVHAGGSCSCHG